MFVVGVDGCKSGWIAVALDNGRFAGATHFETFAKLCDTCSEAVVIGVDIPIGLVGAGERSCDELVRELVGPRRNSVFRTPARQALDHEDYEQANAASREISGHGISKQAHALRRKILEVDRVLRQASADAPPTDDPTSSSQPPASSGELPPASRRQYRHEAQFTGAETRASLRKYARIISPKRAGDRPRPSSSPFPGGRIIEVHPEASFRELSGQPLEHSKKTWNGMMQRMRLLDRAGIDVPAELGEIGRVGVDDVLDAAAVAWTANRYAHHQARSLPPRELWQRDGDRVIAIWI